MNTCFLTDIQIVQASNDDIAEVRRLFRAYADWLNVDLCFQGFEDELLGLPGQYAPPEGRLFLAKAGDASAGCVALRPLEGGVCEMKRLWVEPGFAGYGIGRRLADMVVDAGRDLGYRAMRLDTFPDRLLAAGRIYEKLGFERIPHYYDNPLAGVAMYELALSGTSTTTKS